MRSPGRRRPLIRSRAGGNLGYNMGPTQQDGRSGFIFPRRFMFLQKGVWVHRSLAENTRDRPETY